MPSGETVTELAAVKGKDGALRRESDLAALVEQLLLAGPTVIVEADSWRRHGGRLATESDADRGQLLSIAG